MKQYLHWIDRDTIGNRYDITPLFAHHADFNALVDDLVASVAGTAIDLVACIDALGFILGTAIAQKLEAGILPVRKGGKLPVASDRTGFRDYTGQDKQLEIRRDILSEGSRVLIVDEWIETGAQVSAAINLIENHGAIVAGIATINMDDNEQTRQISARYEVHAVWEKSSKKDKQVLSKLDEIVAEMKRVDIWSENPPSFKVTNYLEAPSFELWLQCVFIPHAREAAEKGEYPERSQVGLMAMREYNYHSFIEKAQPLLRLLNQFDIIIEGK